MHLATKQVGAVAQQADNDVSRGVLFLRLHLHLIECLEQEGAGPGAAARYLKPLLNIQHTAVPARQGEL